MQGYICFNISILNIYCMIYSYYYIVILEEVNKLKKRCFVYINMTT
jgi:hypothetical protein